MYKLGVITHRCQHGKVLWYLGDCCTLVTDVVSRWCVRSATQQLMVVPQQRLSTVGRRAFTVHGLMTSVHSRTMSPSNRAWKLGILYVPVYKAH